MQQRPHRHVFWIWWTERINNLEIIFPISHKIQHWVRFSTISRDLLQVWRDGPRGCENARMWGSDGRWGRAYRGASNLHTHSIGDIFQYSAGTAGTATGLLLKDARKCSITKQFLSIFQWWAGYTAQWAPIEFRETWRAPSSDSWPVSIRCVCVYHTWKKFQWQRQPKYYLAI